MNKILKITYNIFSKISILLVNVAFLYFYILIPGFKNIFCFLMYLLLSVIFICFNGFLFYANKRMKEIIWFPKKIRDVIKQVSGIFFVGKWLKFGSTKELVNWRARSGLKLKNITPSPSAIMPSCVNCVGGINSSVIFLA